jgi:hypothetical protein
MMILNDGGVGEVPAPTILALLDQLSKNLGYKGKDV